MMYGRCKLCDYEDDIDYLHPLYDGRGNDYIMICENCRKKLFSGPEHSKREDLYEECKELGHMNTWMPKGQTLCMRCAALNSMEKK